MKAGSRARLLAGSALIALAALVVYEPALSGGFILDDDRLVSDSALIRAPDGLARFWLTSEADDYWPVTNTSFWLEWRLWGDRPTGYHVTNLALHVMSALLLWSILARLEVRGALLAALLFAVHPVNVQSVAWIAQRKNTLALMLYLVAIRAWLASEAGSRSWYRASLLAFVLAMLSKGSVAVLPAVLLGLVAWRRPVTTQDLVRVVPFALVAVLLTAVNVWFQTHGESRVIRHATLAQRFADAGAVVWFYLGKALWPSDLAFVYPGWIDRDTSWVPLALAVITTVALFLARSRTGRALRAGWCYFCIALLPVMGFVDVGFMKYALVGDHYQYVAIPAVVALVAAALQAARRSVALPIACAAVLALTIAARRQAATYSDPITLYRTALRANPRCSIAHNNLGLLLALAGRRDEAKAHYEQALSIDPRSSDAWSNLGVLLLGANDLIGARRAFESALEAKPRHVDAMVNLGGTMLRQGQTARAVEVLEQAVRIAPEHVNARHAVGIALDDAGRPRDALPHLERAASIDPANVLVLCRLAEVYTRLERGPEALRTGERALELARRQGRMDVAAALETWLTRVRAAIRASTIGRR